MRSYRFALSVAGLGIVIAALLIGWGVRHEASKRTASNPSGTTSTRKFSLPEGIALVRISQAAETLPRIVQATIDPTDVHVGATQKLTVIVQDPDSITSVVAKIQTDHDVITVPLNFVGEAAAAEVLPNLVAVNSDHKVVLLSPAPLSRNIAHAADMPKLKYENSWIVKDTHDTFYHTTFIAKDSKNRESSVTLAWSDACGIPNGGNWTNSADCSIGPADDGVDNSSATIVANTALTVNNGTFGYNPGQSITINTNASIALVNTGQVKETYIWKRDADSDTYPGSSQAVQDNQPAGYARRYTFSNPDDCDDNNSAAWYNPGDSGGVCVGSARYTGGACLNDPAGNFCHYYNRSATGCPTPQYDIPAAGNGGTCSASCSISGC
jgi:hypothetical protein